MCAQAKVRQDRVDAREAKESQREEKEAQRAKDAVKREKERKKQAKQDIKVSRCGGSVGCVDCRDGVAGVVGSHGGGGPNQDLKVGHMLCALGLEVRTHSGILPSRPHAQHPPSADCVVCCVRRGVVVKRLTTCWSGLYPHCTINVRAMSGTQIFWGQTDPPVKQRGGWGVSLQGFLFVLFLLPFIRAKERHIYWKATGKVMLNLHWGR